MWFTILQDVSLEDNTSNDLLCKKFKEKMTRSDKKMLCDDSKTKGKSSKDVVLQTFFFITYKLWSMEMQKRTHVHVGHVSEKIHAWHTQYVLNIDWCVWLVVSLKHPCPTHGQCETSMSFLHSTRNARRRGQLLHKSFTKSFRYNLVLLTFRYGQPLFSSTYLS